MAAPNPTITASIIGTISVQWNASVSIGSYIFETLVALQQYRRRISARARWLDARKANFPTPRKGHISQVEAEGAANLTESSELTLMMPPLFFAGHFMQSFGILQALGFLIAATVLEVSGDATVRIALRDYAGADILRTGLFLLGAALLFGYGTFLNLAPLEFRKVVGLYIATLFIVWQVINYAFFRTLPTLPILLGGSLIVAGGAVVSFWNA